MILKNAAIDFEGLEEVNTVFASSGRAIEHYVVFVCPQILIILKNRFEWIFF